MKDVISRKDSDLLFSEALVVPTLESANLYESYIKEVSSWTYVYSDVMWPRTPEKINSYFNEGRSVLLINSQNNELLAHGAIKWISVKDPILEIGTIVVNPKYKGMGLGTQITKATIEYASKKYPDRMQVAFCNASSLKIFKNLGAVEATMGDLTPEILDGCSRCENKPKPETGRICCDTIVYFPNTAK